MSNTILSNSITTYKNGEKYPFTRLELEGVVCIMEPKEAEAMLTESDKRYLSSTIMLTRNEFESLDEFNGF